MKPGVGAYPNYRNQFSHPFNRHSYSLANTNTHGTQGSVLVGSLQLVNRGSQQAGTAHAQWVTKCNSAALWI